MSKAIEIIEKILYITIATVDDQGQPWNTPVYCAYDTRHNFYWASWEGAQHSKNIAGNPKIFLVIYDSTVPEGTGFGVYIKARASKIEDKSEMENAIKLLYERKNKTPRSTDEFLGDFPRRIYKAVPEKIWVNDDAEVNSNFIDNRKEVELL